MTCCWLVNREANYEAHDLNIINARIDTSITSLQAYDSNKIYEQEWGIGAEHTEKLLKGF